MFRKMTYHDLNILKKKLLNTNLTDVIICLCFFISLFFDYVCTNSSRCACAVY